MQIDKFEGADFKYDNSVFKILAHNYQNRAFLVPNLGIFIISQFQLHKFKGSDFKYDMKAFLSFKIDNKGNSFLGNYCIAK